MDCMQFYNLKNMLFRAPGKANNFEYSNTVHFQPANQINQRSVCTYNNSFTVGQKCSSHEKANRNCDQRFFNFSNQGYMPKVEPLMMQDDDRFKQSLAFKSPTNNEPPRNLLVRENNNMVPLQHECLILRKEKSQLSEKIKRAEDELQNRDNMLRGKQREIEQLKLVHTQSLNTKPQNDVVAQLRAEKQKLYFQVIQLQTEIHKMQEKYEKMQKEHYGLSQKYDELSNKSAMEISRKISREQLLQSELSLSEKRNQRIKTEYEKQLNNLKQKIKQMENESKVYNNKSTVLSYNQSSFFDNYGSIKSQPDLDNSRLEVQKYQSEIKQKNEMIRYLEMQCLKDRKRDSESDSSKMGNIHEECKKDLAKSVREGDNMRKQISSLMSKVASSDKMREQLIKQVKDLEYLLKEVRDKLCKTMEQNRTINKRERQSNERLGQKIQQLEGELLKSSSKFRQSIQETQKTYQKILNEAREKNSAEMMAKDEQLKLYSIEKQELLAKITEYQNLFKENSDASSQLQQIRIKCRQLMEWKQAQQSKISHDLDQQGQYLQKQLKIKVQELLAADSKIISLEKEMHLLKKSIEVRAHEDLAAMAKIQEEKGQLESEVKRMKEQMRRIDEDKRKIEKQFEEFRSLNDLKQAKDQAQRDLLIEIEQVRTRAKLQEQRLYSQITSMREQERKLRNMIGDQERDNLNLLISVENQKRKLNEAAEKIKVYKDQKKDMKTQIDQLKCSFVQKQTIIAKLSQEIRILTQKGENLVAELDKQKQSLTKIHEGTNSKELKIYEMERIIKNLNEVNRTLQQEKAQQGLQLQLKEQCIKDQQEKLLMLQSDLAEARVNMESLAAKNQQNSRLRLQAQALLNKNQSLVLQQQTKLKAMQTQLQAKTEQSSTEGFNMEEMSKKIQQKQQAILKMAVLFDETSKKIITAESEVNKLKQQKQKERILYETTVKQLEMEKGQLAQTIENLKSIIKERASIEDEQRKSLDQKDRYNRQIQNELEELTKQLQQIKVKFLQVQSRKVKSANDLEQQVKGLRVSKMSIGSQSFIADFIEIDKNALLHICDLLGVEPVEGEILRTIIEAIQASNYVNISEYYKEILQLFGVDTELTDKTQETLIIEVKNFRSTLMNLVEKVSILEARIDNLSKENHRLAKLLGKSQFKELRAHNVCTILDGLNEEVMRSNLTNLNQKYKQKDIKYEEM